MVKILVHRKYRYDMIEELHEILDLLQKKLPGEPIYNEQIYRVRVDNVFIDFVYGDIETFSQLRPDYFRAYDCDVVMYFAGKGSKRLTSKDDIVNLVKKLGRNKDYKKQEVASMQNAYNVKLEDKHCYEYNGCLYLNLRYKYETDSGVYELVIPRVDLGILTKGELPIFASDCSGLRIDYCARFNTNCYDLEKTAIPGYGNIAYLINEIKEKRREMTLEEIEKKLGYKVKVVSEKEN